MGRGGTDQESISEVTTRTTNNASSYDKFKQDKLNILYLDADEKVKEAASIIRKLKPSIMALDIETDSRSSGFGPAKGAFTGSIRTIQIGLDEPEKGIPPTQILIDCHNASPRPFTPFLRSRSIEKQIHFLDYEQSWLVAQLGTSIGNIYDTRLASSIIQKHLRKMSPEEIEGIFPKYKKYKNTLAELSRNFLELELPKEQQVSDWGKKRLSPEQLTYAAMDVAILPDLTREVKSLADKIDPSLADEINEATKDRKKKVVEAFQKAKRNNSDESKRIIKAMGRCQTIAELQKVYDLSRKSAILSENSSELYDIYRERKADLAS